MLLVTISAMNSIAYKQTVFLLVWPEQHKYYLLMKKLLQGKEKTLNPFKGKIWFSQLDLSVGNFELVNALEIFSSRNGPLNSPRAVSFFACPSNCKLYVRIKLLKLLGCVEFLELVVDSRSAVQMIFVDFGAYLSY